MLWCPLLCVSESGSIPGKVIQGAIHTLWLALRRCGPEQYVLMRLICQIWYHFIANFTFTFLISISGFHGTLKITRRHLWVPRHPVWKAVGLIKTLGRFNWMKWSHGVVLDIGYWQGVFSIKRKYLNYFELRWAWGACSLGWAVHIAMIFFFWFKQCNRLQKMHIGENFTIRLGLVAREVYYMQHNQLT